MKVEVEPIKATTGTVTIPQHPFYFHLQIPAHLEKDCMMAIISCPYAHLGCIEMVISNTAVNETCNLQPKAA